MIYKTELVFNCLSCFFWKRTVDEYWGMCTNTKSKNGFLTKEDFYCEAYSQKIRNANTISIKVEPVNPWDQAGDVNPQRVR